MEAVVFFMLYEIPLESLVTKKLCAGFFLV